MPGTLRDATELLTRLAAWRTLLVDVAVDLRARRNVVAARAGLDVVAYEQGTTLEMYVDAERSDGSACTLWIDVVAVGEDYWTVEPSVRQMQGQEQVVRQRLEPQKATSFYAVEQELTCALRTFEEAWEGVAPGTDESV